MAKPPGVRYTLGSRWVQSTRAAAQALDARLILGINFEADSPAIARTETDKLLSGLGRRYVAGLELGNEPEVYGTLGWYESAQGLGGLRLRLLPAGLRNAIYEPFAFRHAHGRWTAQVKPMYYGLLMFARAAPPGARLLATTVPGGAGLRVWATRSPAGRVRLVLINESRRRWVTTAVRPPAAATAATAERLRAPRIGARSGVTLGGQTFGSTTTTAALRGSLHRYALSSIQGRFVVRLPPDSATLLTVGRS